MGRVRHKRENGSTRAELRRVEQPKEQPRVRELEQRRPVMANQDQPEPG